MGQVDSAYELQWVQTTAVCQNPQVGDDTKTLKQKTKQNKTNNKPKPLKVIGDQLIILTTD